MRSTYSIFSGVNTDILPNNSKPMEFKHLEKANKIQKKNVKLKVWIKSKNKWSQTKNTNLHLNLVKSGYEQSEKKSFSKIIK